jgi:hypothetical protein
MVVFEQPDHLVEVLSEERHLVGVICGWQMVGIHRGDFLQGFLVWRLEVGEHFVLPWLLPLDLDLRHRRIWQLRSTPELALL